MSSTIRVLSISAIILGLYILIRGLYFTDSVASLPVPYHLGCYLSPHNVTHGLLIAQALENIQKKVQKLKVPAVPVADVQFVEKKGLATAQAFDNFVREYNSQKQLMESYVQLSKAVIKAQEEFRNCSEVLSERAPIQQKKCVDVWLRYQQCTNELGFLKGNLSASFIRKSTIQQKIQSLFNDTTQNPSNNKIYTIDLEQTYRLKDKSLEKEEKNIELSIKSIQDKIESVEYNLNVSKNESIHYLQLYKKLCQQISQEVRLLGFATIESLGQKLQRKRLSILRIQTMLAEDQQGNVNKQELQALRIRSLDQYKKLHKIFIQTKAKLNRNCGCSEKQQQKLYNSYSEHLKQQENIKRQLLTLTQNLRTQQQKLIKVKEARKALLAELQKQMKDRSSTPPSIQYDAVREIKKLEEEQNLIQFQVLQFDNKFDDLEEQCAQAKLELVSYLPKLYETSDCLRKKEYFDNLLSKLNSHKHKLTLNLPTKKKLVEELSSFLI